MSGNRWCLTEVAAESFPASVRMVEVSDGRRVRAGLEKGRACVRCVCEERESLSSAGGDMSAVVGFA